MDLFHTEKVASHILEKYGFHLHKQFPEEMLALYKPMLIHEASRSNNRSQYGQVADKLTGLLKIKGGREVEIELLKKFRSEYVKRPAMMDELSRVL